MIGEGGIKMPTYDYRCEHCGHRLEKFEMMSAPQVQICPKCGHDTLKRLIGAGAGIIFKGSGFYATDYRSPGYDASRRKESERKETVNG
jgi:putative FmdB family regulatory protein